MQCVDCVKAGAKTQRVARTTLGGAVAGGGPVVTYALIGICVAVYLLQMVSSSFESDIVFVPAIGDREPWRFLTAAFAHAGIAHIAFNMIALWTIGQWLESQLGRWRFLAMYLLAALGGSVGYLLLSMPPQPGLGTYGGGWFTPTVGASGAVFGLFGAALVVGRRMGLNMQSLLAVVVLNGIIGFVIPNIAWQAHLGGFVTGLAIAFAVSESAKCKQPMLAWGAMAVVALLLVAASLAKYAVSPDLSTYLGG